MDLLETYFTLTDILKKRALSQSAQLAICYLADGENETERLSYFALDSIAKKIAAKLQALNLSNRHAVLLYSSGIEFVKAFFGCLYAGVVAVPTYVPKSKLLLQKVEEIARDCDAQIILSTEVLFDELRRSYTNASPIFNLPYLTTDINFESSYGYQEIDIISQETAFIQYTSGSTSAPKGVMVSHKCIIHNEKMLQQAFDLNENSIGVSWLPLFHDMGLIAALLNAIYVGYPIYIMPPSAFIRKPIRWLQCISTYKGTYTCAPNFAYDLCIRKIALNKCHNLDLSSLRTVVNAAEPIRHSTIDEFSNIFTGYGFKKEAFVPSYGLAEATVFVSGAAGRQLSYASVDSDNLKNQKVLFINDPKRRQIFVGCGTTNYFGQKVKIVNPENFTECKSLEIGEIWVSGEHIAKGYHNKSETNQLIFNAKTNNNTQETFLRTGDLGFFDESRELFITGRIKDLIIINGRNYYPQDIEVTVENAHAAIRRNSSAAFYIEINNYEQLIVVAEIQRQVAKSINIQEIGLHISSAIYELNELNVYEIIFIVSGSLPKTTSGKIQRQTCKKNYLNNEFAVLSKWRNPNTNKSFNYVQYNEPAITSSEEFILKTKIINCIIIKIATIYNVPIDSISSTSKFSEFNLDSIQLIELSNELEKILNIAVSERIFYEQPTINDIAKHLINLANENIAEKLDAIQKNSYDTINNEQIRRKIAIPKFKLKEKQPESTQG